MLYFFNKCFIFSTVLEKFVISLDEMKFSNYEGIKHLWPWELVKG